MAKRPAIPVLGSDGLTIRDYFAAQILSAMYLAHSKEADAPSFADYAGWAYSVADAMLSAREIR